MADIVFAQPWAVALLLLPFIRWGWAVIRPKPQEKKAAVFYHPATTVLAAIWEKVGGQKATPPRYWPLVLWLVMWSCFTVAAMAPERVKEITTTQQDGVDFVLLVDLSRSMLALDLSQDWRNPAQRATRLDEVKKTVRAFIDMRQGGGGDRFGLVFFGERAYVASALTHDGKAVQSLLETAQVGLAGDATAIGDALAQGIQLLKDRTSKSRVIILLTDGDSNAGSVLPEDAARLVQRYGLKFYAIAVGASDRVPFPQEGGILGMNIVAAEMPMDFALLQRLGTIAGGSAVRARDAASLKAAYAQIHQLEKSPAETSRSLQRTPLYRWPLGAGLVLLLVWFALREWKNHE